MSPSPTVQQSQAALAKFAALDPPPITTAEEREQAKTDLLALAQATDYQMFGILAETCDQAIAALTAYSQAFGYEMPTNWQPITGPTYLKFNPNLGSCYTDNYVGNHRGVLISFQSESEEIINQTYGHFPLDLFSNP
ncbi:DUF1824 family protein [Acaryochloris marina]|uniref:DUF1824 domain-containing protein n=1 Tax=Acaryochloris marina (strain MBIC 11017) TaxID=329726 RepID=B0CD48_ACAM1|nr:DUF1824 family protein [Acaryochloris marina]ABW25639.1 conserved hypothetical protein [Acaryochloris marina MBIC11017]BDM80512.1 hypothetical protein AM10699_33800 [Acaryochloris marina MBIC10699]